MVVETELQLSKVQSVTLDAKGYGEVRIGPSKPGERWKVTIMNTANDGSLQPIHKVFRGPAGHGQQLDYTRSGKGDTSPTEIELRTGDYLTATWSGGTVGSQSMFTVEGIQYLVGKRAY